MTRQIRTGQFLVPDHLMGTRAALFHLWWCIDRQNARTERAETLRAAPSERPRQHSSFSPVRSQTIAAEFLSLLQADSFHFAS